jgi:hypothetical protein
MKKDIQPNVDHLFEQHLLLIKTLYELEKTNCVSSTIDDRACEPSAFLWKNLKHQSNRSLSLEQEFEHFSSFPEFSLAALLESLQDILTHASHLTIAQSEDNKLSYCISGQVSLDELKKLCEHHIFHHPDENKK